MIRRFAPIARSVAASAARTVPKAAVPAMRAALAGDGVAVDGVRGASPLPSVVTAPPPLQRSLLGSVRLLSSSAVEEAPVVARFYQLVAGMALEGGDPKLALESWRSNLADTAAQLTELAKADAAGLARVLNVAAGTPLLTDMAEQMPAGALSELLEALPRDSLDGVMLRYRLGAGDVLDELLSVESEWEALEGKPLETFHYANVVMGMLMEQRNAELGLPLAEKLVARCERGDEMHAFLAQALTMKGLFQTTAGQVDAALDSMRAGLEACGGDASTAADIRDYEAQLLMVLNRADEAITSLRAAASLYSKLGVVDAQVRSLRTIAATLVQEKADMEGAQAALAEAKAAAGSDGCSLSDRSQWVELVMSEVELSAMHTGVPSLELTTAALQSLAELPPGPPGFLLRFFHAHALRDAGRTEEELQTLREASHMGDTLQLKGNTPVSLHTTVAVTLSKAGEWEEAKVAAEAAIAAGQSDGSSAEVVGTEGDPSQTADMARALFLSGYIDMEHNGAFMLSADEPLFKQAAGKLKRSCELMDKLMPDSVDHGMAMALVGGILHKEGDLDGSAEMLERAKAIQNTARSEGRLPEDVE